MKTLTSLLAVASLSSVVFAGPVADYSKGGKAPVMPPSGCECFAPGLALGFFGGAAIYTDASPDGMGGGVLGEYFFNEYFGLQVSYGAFATSPVHHNYDLELILRYPIKSRCIAPYLMVGGGGDINGEHRGQYNAGAGIEARFESLDCMGVFLDGSYHFAGDNHDNDYTNIRLGVKFPF